MKNVMIVCSGLLLLLICGCCKHKEDLVCNPSPVSVSPVLERRTAFQCNNNDEYTYIFRKHQQMDSLQPTCFTIAPIAFPVDETSMLYLIVGRLSYYRKDTIGETFVTKDTCGRKLIYEVNMIQRDTTLAAGGLGAVMSIFCSVENIPADYQVEVKYKYVPIP